MVKIMLPPLLMISTLTNNSIYPFESGYSDSYSIVLIENP